MGGRALDGVKVLDMGSYLAGPYGCMLLADHGAEVIRIEPPGGKVDRELGPHTPEGHPVSYGLTVQRNKKNITLNLRSETGVKLLDEFVKKVDVIIHNNPKGTDEAKLLDYERLRQINPAIIVVAVSGFGQTGPYSERLCFDAIAQAMCGSMSFNGFPGMPPVRASVPFIDFNSAVRVALGAMLALYERKASGQGQFVDIALFDVAFSLTGCMGVPYEYKVQGEVRKAVGNGAFYAYCCSAPAKDGYVMINVIGNSQWRRMCRLMNREDIINDPRFKDNTSRYRNYLAIDAIVNEWLKDMTVSEVMNLLDKTGIPCGPVNDVPASLNVPQIEAREMLVEVDCPGSGKVPIPGVTIKLSRTPGKVAKRASFMGEDNESVYGSFFGYGPDELKKLKEEKAI